MVVKTYLELPGLLLMMMECADLALENSLAYVRQCSRGANLCTVSPDVT